MLSLGRRDPTRKEITMQTNNKLRDALEFIKLASDDYEVYGITKAGALDVIHEKACAALAEPVRNCDVGSPEDQSERMAKFCREQFEKTDGVELCSGCPFHGVNRLDCQFAWAQMPYEEENLEEKKEELKSLYIQKLERALERNSKVIESKKEENEKIKSALMKVKKEMKQ